MISALRIGIVALVIGAWACVTGGCSPKDKDEVSAGLQQQNKWEQEYQANVLDLEKGYTTKGYKPTYLDSLRFIKTVILGQNFTSDSGHIDSLICLSQSHRLQNAWDTLLRLDLSDVYNRDVAEKLIKTIREGMQPDGCIFGNIGPTSAQLKNIEDSCRLYNLQDFYRRTLENANVFSVEGSVDYLMQQADTIPGLLPWLGTTPDDLRSLKMQGYRSGAMYYLLQAYRRSGVQSTECDPLVAANQYRELVGWSIEELAQRADVPMSWIQWAYRKCNLTYATVQTK